MTITEIAGYGQVLIQPMPYFAPLVLAAFCFVVLLTPRPVNLLALATILSVSLGRAFSMNLALMIKAPYVFASVFLIFKLFLKKPLQLPSNRTLFYLSLLTVVSFFSMAGVFDAPYLGDRTETARTYVQGLTFRTVFQFGQLVLMALIFLIAFQYCRERERFRRVARLFTWCTFFAVGYAVYELVTLYVPGIPYLNLALPYGEIGGYRISIDARSGLGRLYRPSGFFGEPSWFADYLFLAIPLLSTDIMLSNDRKLRKCLLFGISFLMLVLTGSRIALASSVGIAVALCLIASRRLFPLASVLAFLGLSFFGSGYVIRHLLQRLPETYHQGLGLDTETINAMSPLKIPYYYFSNVLQKSRQTKHAMQSRFESWNEGLEIFSQRPIFGVGIGNYSFWIDSGHGDLQPHNLYIRILAELGLIGSAVFLLFIGSIVIRLFIRFIRCRHWDYEVYAYAVAMLSAIIGLSLQKIAVDALTNDPLYWTVLGMAAAVAYMRFSEKNQAPFLSSQ